MGRRNATRRGKRSEGRGAQVAAGQAPGGLRGLKIALAFLVVIALLALLPVVLPLFKPVPPVLRPTADRSLDQELAAQIEHYATAAEKEPRESLLRCTLGLLYEANELWAEAVGCYDNCIALGAADPVWSYHRAIAMRQAGQSEKAIDVLRNLEKRYPSKPWILFRLAQWEMESGRNDVALSLFRRVRGMQPDAVEPLVGLGTALVRDGQFTEAASLLERAVETDPLYRAGKYALGLAYRGLQRLDEAEPLLQAGMDARVRYLRDPRTDDLQGMTVSYSSVVDRAASLIEGGRPAEAATALERALRARPRDVAVLTNLAAAYAAVDRYDEAIDLLKQSVEVDPTHFPGYINLTNYLLEQGKPEKAIPYADLAIEHGKEIGHAHFARARALAMLNRIEESAAELAAADRLNYRDPMLHMALGEINVKLGRYEDARAAYRRGVQSEPRSMPMWISLSAVCLQLNELGEAQEALDQARRLAPNHPRVQALQERINEARKAGP